ncbi:hypothetical protein AB6A40_000451 [Gnathostoma spinigerum]|uniref:Pre-rRNA-processing protein RIX1 N-terminal domain-containing protein n=1 Tax=Gnathostoma spinigerum TaxID=75299 RepID=A0ABD6EAN6_9BILA
MDAKIKELYVADRVRKNAISLTDFFGQRTELTSVRNNEVEISWLALAKVIEQCDSETLRAIISRLQKKLIHAAKQPMSLAILYFLNSVITHVPSMRQHNTNTFCSLLCSAVDFAVESDSLEAIGLVADVFAQFAGDKYERVLLESLECCLSSLHVETVPVEESIQFNTCNQQRLRTSFAVCVFTIHSAKLELLSSGLAVDVFSWLAMARRVLELDVEALHDVVFTWLNKLIVRSGSAIQIAHTLISSLFIDFLCARPTFYKSLSCFVSRLSPSSLIVDNFKQICDSARRPLHEQVYGDEYAEAVSSVIENCVFLVSVPLLKQLQRTTCLEVLRYPQSSPCLRLLCAFLSIQHELVPIPIQVAQSVFCRFGNVDAKSKRLLEWGRSLCGCISRPQIQSIVPRDKWTTLNSEFERIELETTNTVKKACGVECACQTDEINEVEQTMMYTRTQKDENEDDVMTNHMEMGENDELRCRDIVGNIDRQRVESKMKKKKRKKKKKSKQSGTAEEMNQEVSEGPPEKKTVMDVSDVSDREPKQASVPVESSDSKIEEFMADFVES